MPLVLAVPYLMPYAQLAGWAIGGLGLYEISKRVQAHMESNPEESFRILKMIMPREGIAAMFEQLFNKEADDVEGEVEVEEEDLTQLSGKEKGKKMKEEAQKKEGSYASPEAEGSWASPRGRIIRALKEEGKISDKPDKDYDPSKKYQGYKRFIRGRTGRKADGGIMDVL